MRSGVRYDKDFKRYECGCLYSITKDEREEGHCRYEECSFFKSNTGDVYDCVYEVTSYECINKEAVLMAKMLGQ